MFDKKKFAIIIEKIKNEYDSQEKFSEASGINRTYLSQYMNMRIDEAPTPGTLYKLASASKGITTYDALLSICGYYDSKRDKLKNSLRYNVEFPVYAIPLFTSVNGELVSTGSDVWLSIQLNKDFTYFGYQTIDKSMAPLLNIKDIAIIQKKELMEIDNGRTYLLKYENNILIRKIIEKDDRIELHAMNPYYPIIETTKEKIEILGRVIKAEIQSAFN